MKREPIFCSALLLLTGCTLWFGDQQSSSKHDLGTPAGSWTVIANTDVPAFSAIGGFDQEIYAAGAASTMLHSQDGGKTFASTTSPSPNEAIRSIYGTASGFTVAGAAGIFFRGAQAITFDQQLVATNHVGDIYAVAGPGPTNLFAVDYNSRVFHFDGSSWTNLSGTSMNLFALQSVVTDQTGKGVAGGGSAEIVIVPELAMMKPLGAYGAPLRGAGIFAGKFYFVGDSGGIFHSTNRTDWTREPCPGTPSLYAIAQSGELLFAVGAGGTILRSTLGSSQWTMDGSPVTTDLVAAWSAADGEVFAVGNGGTIVHWP